MRLLSVFIGCAFLIIQIHGAKILAIFPMPSKSHFILGDTMAKGFVQRGHEVTMISPFASDKPMKNYNHVIINGMGEVKQKFGPKFSNVNTNTWDKLALFYSAFPEVYEVAHNDSNVKEFVKKGEKYDLCIVSFLIIESMFGICHAVQAPAIGFSMVGMSSFLSYHLNNPVPYSYAASLYIAVENPSGEMTFYERLNNIATWWFFDAVMHYISMPHQADVLNRYYPNAPSLDVLMEDVDLYFLNSHISTDSPKPLLPNVIPIGGFHLQVMEEIPDDVKKFLDNSKKGVVYFNMGSNVKSTDLEPPALKAIINALSQTKYDVLWKFEADLPNKPKHIHVAQWLPQRPILMHPNVKMFVTHGGLGGTAESIYGGVPMICLPMFGDQHKNCGESALKGFGITVDLKTITEEKLLDAINEMGTNSSYKEKILLKTDLYRNQEVNPMDKVIFWAEHVITHKGAKHLKSRAHLVPWYQYYLLDVIALLISVMITLLGLTYYISKLSLKTLCHLIGKFTGSKKPTKIKNTKKIKKH